MTDKSTDDIEELRTILHEVVKNLTDDGVREFARLYKLRQKRLWDPNVGTLWDPSSSSSDSSSSNSSSSNSSSDSSGEDSSSTDEDESKATKKRKRTTKTSKTKSRTKRPRTSDGTCRREDRRDAKKQTSMPG